MGPFYRNSKYAYCLDHYSDHLLFNIAYQIFTPFRDMNRQRISILAPRDPLLRIIWPKEHNILLQIVKMNNFASVMYHKILIIKELKMKDFWPLWAPNLRSQPILLDIKRKVLWFQRLFVLHLFRDFFSFRRYALYKYLGATPTSP